MSITTEQLKDQIAILQTNAVPGESDWFHLIALRELLVVREAPPVKFALSTHDGYIQSSPDSVFNSQEEAESALAALSASLSLEVRLKVVPLYTVAKVPQNESITISKEGWDLICQAVGGHAAILQFMTLGRHDLALEEARKWVDGFAQAAVLLNYQQSE